MAVLGTASADVPLLIPPNWASLPARQKAVLAPLAGEWDQLEAWRRMKWLEIADRYPSMTQEEQARVQRRMKDWVKLSPEERKAARERYKNVQKATPEQREALKQMWSEYKTLPEEEKRRFRSLSGGGTATTPSSSTAGSPPSSPH